MRFLNGWKTILGAAGLIATTIFPHVAPDAVAGALAGADSILQGAFGMLTAIGVIHKAEKLTDRQTP